MKPLDNKTQLAAHTKWYNNQTSNNVYMCGQILLHSLHFMNKQYSPHNLQHQVQIPIADLTKHNDAEVLQTMVDWLVRQGYNFVDDFMIGLFKIEDENYMTLVGSFRTLELATLFKMYWG